MMTVPDSYMGKYAYIRMYLCDRMCENIHIYAHISQGGACVFQFISARRGLVQGSSTGGRRCPNE